MFLPDVLPAFVIVGVGAPIAFVPATATAMASTGQAAGLASGVFNTAQQIGNAIALAAMATLAASRTATLLNQGLAHPTALNRGYQAGFLLAAALAIAGAFAALKLRDPAPA